MSKTLYVTDLDGTLLNSDIDFSNRTVEIINKLINKGMNFTCATARSQASAKRFLDKLDLKLPIVTYNGAVLANAKSGEILDACIMDNQKLQPILDMLEQKKICPIVYSVLGGKEKSSWLEGKENDGVMAYLKSRAGDPRLRPTKSYQDLFAGGIFLITIIGSQNQILPLEPLVQNNPHITYHLQADIYNQKEYWLEIGRHDSTKSQGIAKLKKFCPATNLITFGDHLNDLSMFSISDECYAVQNAHEILKQKATDIIASNNDDGVALWLEKNADIKTK